MSSNAESSSIFARWLQPLLYVLSGAAATYILLQVNWPLAEDATDDPFSTHTTPPTDSRRQQPTRELRRRNAIRRRPQRTTDDSGGLHDPHTPTSSVTHVSNPADHSYDYTSPIISLDRLERSHGSYGEFRITLPNTNEIRGDLIPSRLPSLASIAGNLDIAENEAVSVRYLIEMAFLDQFLLAEFPVGRVIRNDTDECEYLLNALMRRGVSEQSITADFIMFNQAEDFAALVQSRRIMSDFTVFGRSNLPHIDFILRTAPAENNGLNARQRQRQQQLQQLVPQDEISTRPPHRDQSPDNFAAPGLPESVDRNANCDGQDLLNLLYHVTEDQARRDGFIHRGVACNSCGVIPIHGIRYRCSNCIDFDLCESCEALQIHTKTHLFYKVRIPAPFLGNPRQVQPVVYPGKPAMLRRTLPRGLSQKLTIETTVETPELDALWEQFRCLAGTEWPEDPNDLHMAIDRRTFDKCFVSNISSKPPPPNLIYDRIFSYYDTNGDGLIGFQEFVQGLASLGNKSVLGRCRRVFEAYDLDGDGYVERRDFLRIFRTYYSSTKEVVNASATANDDENLFESGPRDVVLGSQPISAAFTVNLTQGDSLNRRIHDRAGEGKAQSVHGDWELLDGEGLFRENETMTGDRNDVVGENAVRHIFGSARPGMRTRRFLRQHLQYRRDPSFLAFLSEADAAFIVGDDDSLDMDLFVRQFQPDRPEDYIVDQDIREALDGKSIRYGDITDPLERAKVQYVAAQRMDRQEGERMERLRRHGVEERWSRRAFYTDEEDGSAMPSCYKSEEDEQQLHLNDDNHNISNDNDNDNNDDNEGGNDNDKYGNNYDYDDDDDDERAKNTKHRDENIEAAEEASAIPPSPRSRSSSKVRFQDDVTGDEYETRSNTSSRSIPVGERWGGFEIPEIERDVGKEILYQMVQEGINELLDFLFKYKEDLVMEARQTRRQRRRWAKEIDEFVESSPNKISLRDYKMLILGLANEDISFDVKGDSYSEDYYDNDDDDDDDDNADIMDRTDYTIFSDQPSSPIPASMLPADLSPYHSSEHLLRNGHADPTLPQHRPNSSDLEPFPPVPASPTHASLRTHEASPSTSNSMQSVPSSPISTAPRSSPTRDPASSSNDKENELPFSSPPGLHPLTPPTTRSSTHQHHQQQQQQQQQPNQHRQGRFSPRRMPSAGTLERWHRLNQVEQEVAERGGSGAKLNIQEFAMRMQCDREERLGFLADWIDMNGF